MHLQLQLYIRFSFSQCGDCFMQEAKSVNGRLVAYLRKPDNLRKLVLYVIGQPPAKPGEAARESDVRTRHSLAACEALCSLAEELPELLSGNEALLRTLFSATGADPALTCPCACAGITLLSPMEPCIQCTLALAPCGALCSRAEELPELLSDNEALLCTLFRATGL